MSKSDLAISPKTEVRTSVKNGIAIVVAIVSSTICVMAKLQSIEGEIQQARWEATQARKDCVSEDQARRWLDEARLANRGNNASVEWPSLPPK